MISTFGVLRCLLVGAVFLGVCGNVTSRSTKAKRATPLVQPGCCPPSFSFDLVGNYGGPERTSKVHWNADQRMIIRVSQNDELYIYTDETTIRVNTTRDCLLDYYAPAISGGIKNYFCLQSDAEYVGRRQMTPGDLNTVTADVYLVGFAGQRIYKYYSPSETNCIPIGEEVESDRDSPIGFVYKNVRLGKSEFPNDYFQVPSSYC